ncbi:MAG: class I SAM-dependent methyltransferase [Acidobacteria bacterium]|nr:class I SAM-dependent methyltransferase [Acidobacteriota bacterium]
MNVVSFIERLRTSRRATRLRRALGIGDPGAGVVFSRIYEKNLWGDPESRSGRGSTLARTVVIRSTLPALLEGFGARSLLDAACGDFNWMALVDLGGVRYVGVDVVPGLIERNRRLYGGENREFLLADITRDPLPEADVVLCRDCLIHHSLDDALAAVLNFRRSNSRRLLATTHPAVRRNLDVPTGSWRPLNLQLPPFGFPPPARLLTEDAGLGKCLGLWELESL